MLKLINSNFISIFIFASTPGFAGYKAPPNVVQITSLSNGETIATGIMGDVRATNDSIQLIGCSLTAVKGGNAPEINCVALTNSGSYVACWTTNGFYAGQVMSINRNSKITFRSDANKQCTFLEIVNGSSFRPMDP
jgi:hypothetical protein